MDTISKIKKSVKKTKSFLTHSLALWDKVGYDHEYGGYFEALDFDAKPIHTLDKRFRIHPRTIFAHAAGTIWGYYDGLETAEKAFQHITKHCWLEDGGFATLSNRKGKIIDSSIYTYDHAFVMLGLGWLYKASGNPLHKTYLYNTWDMLQSRLIHTDKGFITSVPEPITPRRVQNPHMHMLEAMINLVILFDKDIWKDAAKQLYTLFTRYFCLSHEKKIREFFNDDWSLDVLKGHLLEPGHHYEWVWILEQYETIMNKDLCANTTANTTASEIPLIKDVYDFAILGSNTAGMGYNETDYDGVPTRSEHRMWIQTEVIKANVAMYRKTKNPLYLERMYDAWQTLFSKYLIEKHAIWYDEIDDEGNNISTNAPTSTLYHLLIAFHEYITLAEAL